MQRWPWESLASDELDLARHRMRAFFELTHKLGVDLWCFHDRDIAPTGATMAETNSNLDEIVDLAEALQAGGVACQDRAC